MKYLTIQEFADLYGISRQAVEDRIRRKTLPCVIRKVEIDAKRIPVEDIEYEKRKGK